MPLSYKRILCCLIYFEFGKMQIVWRIQKSRIRYLAVININKNLNTFILVSAWNIESLLDKNFDKKASGVIIE